MKSALAWLGIASIAATAYVAVNWNLPHQTLAALLKEHYSDSLRVEGIQLSLTDRARLALPMPVLLSGRAFVSGSCEGVFNFKINNEGRSLSLELEPAAHQKLTNCLGSSTDSVADAPTPSSVNSANDDDVMTAVFVDLAVQAVKKYELVVRNGTVLDMCLAAQEVAQFYLQATDEKNYAKWKKEEVTACAATGLVSAPMMARPGQAADFAANLTKSLMAAAPKEPVYVSPDAIMTQVGECTDTTIKRIGNRLGGDPQSGHHVEYANGIIGISRDHIAAIGNSMEGDAVRLCLIETPENCSDDDKFTGRVYRAVNSTNNSRWDLANSAHACN